MECFCFHALLRLCVSLHFSLISWKPSLKWIPSKADTLFWSYRCPLWAVFTAVHINPFSSGGTRCVSWKTISFPGGTPGVTWLKIRFMWKMNLQYGIFFNERIRHKIQKTGSYLFIRFRSNHILSFVNRNRKRKYPQKTLNKKLVETFFVKSGDGKGKLFLAL